MKNENLKELLSCGVVYKNHNDSCATSQINSLALEVLEYFRAEGYVVTLQDETTPEGDSEYSGELYRIGSEHRTNMFLEIETWASQGCGQVKLFTLGN